MISVRLATIKDIPDLIGLLRAAQETKNIGHGQIIDPGSFAEYMRECIFSGGIYSFVAVEHDQIVGLLVLNEVTCPWNFGYVYGSDLLFVALKGGPKLIKTAKRLAQRKNWSALYFTTSMSNPRADGYFQKIAAPVGGTFKIEV